MAHYLFHAGRGDVGKQMKKTEMRARADGRFDISFNHRIEAFFHHETHQDDSKMSEGPPTEGGQNRSPAAAQNMSKLRFRSTKMDYKPVLDTYQGTPRLNIAILIVGSRGDVQPFIALGKALQAPPYSHRVRIGTHAVFRDFVEEHGLEFFSIGGDPEKLMSYMVRNPGVMPTYDSMKAGDVSARRKEIGEMLEGAWRACTQAGNGIDPIEPFADDGDVEKGLDDLLRLPAPFVADAIIANPPSYAHIHIAEKLGIPLHLMFTMPWSPTSAFPHPLANIDASKVNASTANYLSYGRLEYLTWEGLADIINHFREKTLFLDPVHPAWGHQLFSDLKVPFTYCWSPALIPKPVDWGDHINVSGFFFLSMASSYSPPPDLQAFLDAGDPPVYIGFGSIVVDDPARLTSIVLDAVRKLKVRVLLSKGWGKLGGDDVPENVFLLGNVPHDWLFPRCSAVVHHGGAGTSAIGIALGKPTVIVPFFGDQPWWAGMIARAGASPVATPWKKLTAEILAGNIEKALSPEMKSRAEDLSRKIKHEDGVATAVETFHSMPQMQQLQCFLRPDRVAVWRIRRTNIRLSSMAAACLVLYGKLNPERLKLLHHKRWLVEEGAQDPLIGLVATFGTLLFGYLGDIHHFKTNLGHKDDDTATPGKASAVLQASQTMIMSLAGHTFKSPFNLLYNLANGFHNAPRHLFRDRTVRVRNPITGAASGLKVGFESLGYGLFDAVTGLVTQPYHGYKAGVEKNTDSSILTSAAIGVGKGLAQGLGGLVFKAGAAALAVPGYCSKGLEREMENMMSGSEAITKESIAAMSRARQASFKRSSSAVGKQVDEEAAAAMPLWELSTGSGASRYILLQRIWEGYRNIYEMKRKELDSTILLEEQILTRWSQLRVSDEFVS